MAKAKKSVSELLTEASAGNSFTGAPLFKHSEGELKNQFTYHPATEVTGPQFDEVRAACLTLARKLSKLMPDCYEAMVAVAKVREAMFFANAAIACRTPLPEGK